MPKPRTRSYSGYAIEALVLLGKMVRCARTERRMTARELAERAGISRDMLHRIEKGDPRCEIGAVFEVATIVGITLFEPDTTALQGRSRSVDDKLALLPKAVRQAKMEVKDDF